MGNPAYVDQIVRIIGTSDYSTLLRRTPIGISTFRPFRIIAIPIAFLYDRANQSSEPGSGGASNGRAPNRPTGKAADHRPTRRSISGPRPYRTVACRKTDG